MHQKGTYTAVEKALLLKIRIFILIIILDKIIKIVLDIKDDKVAFIMELLRNFTFVKAKPLNLDKAVKEVNQVKAGKKEAQPLSEFLHGL